MSLAQHQTASATKNMLYWSWILLPMVAWFAFYIDIIAPVLPAIGETFNLPPQTVLGSMTLYIFATGIAQWLMGRYAHILSLNTNIYLSYFILLLGTGLIIYITNWPTYLLGRLMQGVGGGFLYILSFKIVRDQINNTYLRQQLCGKMNASIAASWVLIPPLGAWAYEYHQCWRSPYIYLTIILCIHFITIFFMLKPNTNAIESEPSQVQSQTDFPYRLASYLIICGTTQTCYNFLFLTYSPYIFIENLNVSVLNYSWIVSGLGCVHTVTCYAYPYIIQRLNDSIGLMIGQSILLICGLLLLFSASHENVWGLIMIFTIGHIASSILITGSVSALVNHPHLKSDKLLGHYGSIKCITAAIVASYALNLGHGLTTLAMVITSISLICVVAHRISRSDLI